MTTLGLTLLPDPNLDLNAALALGCQTYLIMVDGAGLGYQFALQIHDTQPDARVYLRRDGGLDNGASLLAQLKPSPGQGTPWYDMFAGLGYRDWLLWNEPDRPSEGGWSVAQVARFADGIERAIRPACPGIRLHFPAFTKLSAYQDPDQWVWLPVARRYDVLDLHCYGPGQVAAYLQWAASRLPGQPTAITEFSQGLGNPRGDLPGLMRDSAAAARASAQCESLIWFTWSWPGAEPGGQALELARDENADARQAWAAAATSIRSPDTSPVVAAPPKPVAPPATPVPEALPGWQAENESSVDDGDDCQLSAPLAAVHHATGQAPTMATVKAAYQRLDPTWIDSGADNHLPVPDRVIQAFAAVGYAKTLVSWDAVPGLLAKRQYPTVWAYIWGGQWYTHEMVLIERSADGYIHFWEQQHGHYLAARETDFLAGQGLIRYAGRVYLTTPVTPPATPQASEKPMLKSAMLHQFDALSERSYAEIAATLRSGGISTLKVKTHDGTDWMARFDTSPLAVGSVDGLTKLVATFAAEGIDVIPWCVPTGGDVDAEVALALQVAAACGQRLEVDLEQGQGFWTQQRGRIVEYFRRLHDAGVAVDCDSDMRATDSELLPLADLSGLCRRFLSQSYWTDFKRPAEAVIHDALTFMREKGATDLGVIFPDADPASFGAAARIAAEAGVREIGLWKLGSAGPDCYAALAQIPGAPAPTPAPAPRPAEGRAGIFTGSQYEQSSLDWLGALWGLAETVADLDQGAVRAQLEAAVVAYKTAAHIP